MRRSLYELAAVVLIGLGAVAAYGEHRERIGRLEADLADSKARVAGLHGAYIRTARALDSALHRAALDRAGYERARERITPEILTSLPLPVTRFVEVADLRNQGCSLVELTCAEHKSAADSLRAAQGKLTDDYDRRLAAALRDQTTAKLTWGSIGIAVGTGACLLIRE